MEQRCGSPTRSGLISPIAAPVSFWPTSRNTGSSMLQQNPNPASLCQMQKEEIPLVSQSHYSPVLSPTSSGASICSTPKVAIPRIAAPSNLHERRRAVRACEPCRQRKVKCNSQRPTCGQCDYVGKRCVYEDVKRVRNEKKIDQLTKQVERYEHMLRDIAGDVDAPTAHKIRRTMKFKDEDQMNHENEDEDDSAPATIVLGPEDPQFESSHEPAPSHAWLWEQSRGPYPARMAPAR